MHQPLGVVMVLSDGFGGFGGIAKFNRDFLAALDLSPSVSRVHALPRLISDPIDQPLPQSIAYDRKSARGKVPFVQRVVFDAFRKAAVNLVICGHLNLLPIAWFLARARRARLVLIVHGIEAWTASRSLLTRGLAPRIDSLVAVSRHSADRFASWSGVPAARSVILPNCVDLDRFKPQARDPRLVHRYGLEDKQVILTVGRLDSRERHKGFDEVIEAVPKLLGRFPALRYLIVGDGPDRPRLEDKARALGVAGEVVFAGRIAEEDKVAHYALADLYVMPSIGEGFGIVLIEAAACGLPIIGSAADGSREALLDGALGDLIDPRDPKLLVRSIERVLAAPPPRLRKDAVETFGIDCFNARVDAWLRDQAAALAATPA